MFGLGIGEVVIILFIALIFIGPKKLPELAKGLGKGLREFQGAMKGFTSTIQTPLDQIHEQKSEIEERIKNQFKADPPHNDEAKPEDKYNDETPS
jgi:TatA/E family protein of Tat protein translocase